MQFRSRIYLWCTVLNVHQVDMDRIESCRGRKNADTIYARELKEIMAYPVLVLSNYRYLTMEGEVIVGHAPTDVEIAAIRQLPRDERVGRISPGLFGLSFSESHRERWEAAAASGGHDLDELIGPVVWSVSSRLDESRWFRSMGDMAWTADDETSLHLYRLPTHTVALRPTGPWRDGVFTPGELLAAVYNVVPAAEVHGDPPDFPYVSPLPPDAIP